MRPPRRGALPEAHRHPDSPRPCYCACPPPREARLDVCRVNIINMVLAVLSCVAAFMLPFELFLFS